MAYLLEHLEFRNPERTRLGLAWLQSLEPALAQRVQTLLDSVPDPDQALHYLGRLHQDSPEYFERIHAIPTALRYLVTVFSYSGFLSEAVLKNPEWILDCAQAHDMLRVLPRDTFCKRLTASLDSATALPSAVALARFRRREILRIVLRDVLGMASLSDVAEELSNLADAILKVAYTRTRQAVSERLNFPCNAPFCVIALGKLGGRELNYSSDIDLLFVYDGANGAVSDAGMSVQEFLQRVANEYTALLSTYTTEGLCYRVDLRLRPDGRYGEVCHSLGGATQYYGHRARDWELQMLIKARVCAGDPAPGQALLQFATPLIYSTTLDFKAIEAVSETRERMHEKLRRSQQPGLDLKLARGGIRDIEFLVQCLQRLHGGRDPWVRHGGTLMALFRLRDKGFLSGSEYARLVSAYQFLRNLEHRLQFDEDLQTHTLPVNPDALAALARKMPGHTHDTSAGSLQRELDGHLEDVRELYERVIYAQKPTYDLWPDAGGEPQPATAPQPFRGEFPSSNLARVLEQRTPQFATSLQHLDAARGGDRMEHFLEKLVAQPEWLHRIEEHSDLARCVVDLFDHSAYFSDQLIRYPALLDEVQTACGSRQGRTGFEPPEDAGELRRFFRRQMIRIQSDSVHHSVNVFRTLARTSALADSVIVAAYRIALREARQSAPPLQPGYQPAGQMMVIALGRLGMREFDLASDADLVFAIPDEDAPEHAFWTLVAEQMIHAISAYTGDGVIFSVDTRLRPNGRSGPLVQTEKVFKEYFEHSAETWEGISYMKARAVAGDLDRATGFLNSLQEVDWRRYGQSGRSRRELAGMRARLEKEQGARNPLKAGRGGYYDIDFALLYLRLKGAGIFFKVLNTQERIDVVEKMGHLDREDANFLRQAATFYRALDHGLRIATGHAEGRLPTSPAQIAVLTELVHRWAPPDAGETTLEARLAQYRHRTRQFFDRLFA